MGHHKSQFRKEFIKCLSIQLSINHLREIANIASLEKQVSDAITTKLQHIQATDEEEEETNSHPLVSLVSTKCVIYIQNLRGVKEEDC